MRHKKSLTKEQRRKAQLYWQTIVGGTMREVGDEVDLGNEQAQLILDMNLAIARTVQQLPSTGHCYNCGDAVSADNRFCDVNCRNDYQARHPNA